jgi:hypothetical protein
VTSDSTERVVEPLRVRRLTGGETLVQGHPRAIERPTAHLGRLVQGATARGDEALDQPVGPAHVGRHHADQLAAGVPQVTLAIDVGGVPASTPVLGAVVLDGEPRRRVEQVGHPEETSPHVEHAPVDQR